MTSLLALGRRSLMVLALVCLSSTYVYAQTEEPFEQSLQATAPGTVNVRGDASTQTPAITTLRAGSKIIILDQIADGEAVKGNSLWYHVQLDDGTTGFVWSGAVSQPTLVQTCVRPRQPQSDEVWLAIHNSQIPLITWDSAPHSPRLTPGKTTGSEPLAWSSVVTSAELATFLAPFGKFNVSPLIDETGCVDYGAILNTPQVDLYAVHETPGSVEIAFIDMKDVTRVRRAGPDDLQKLAALIQTTQRIQRFTEQPNAPDFLDEKIAYEGILPYSVTAKRPAGIRRLFFAPIHTGSVYRLTTHSESAFYEEHPTWSRDGSRVVFDYSPTTTNEGLGFLDLGTQQQVDRIYPNGELVVGPSLSGDGTLLAVMHANVPFSSQVHEGRITVVSSDPNQLDRIDGQTIYSEAARPGTCIFCFTDLHWSPDNRLLAFDRIITQQRWEVWITSSESQEAYKVGNGTSPTWSPNGQYLLYSDLTGSNTTGWRSKIYRADGDGRNSILLTPTPTTAVFGCLPVWSPDSEQIALCDTTTGDDFTSLYLMDKNGGNGHALTKNLDVSGVTWSPDGTQIAFVARQPNDESGYEAIYTINVDGTDQHLLIDGIDYSSDLVWLPAITN